MRQFIVLLTAVVVGCQALPDVSSTEQETVVVISPGNDFGDQTLGTTSAVRGLVVSPAAGNQSDRVTAVTASCPDFVIDAGGLPAEVYRVCEVITCTNRICPISAAICQTTEIVTYSFDAAFRPTVPGRVSCVVNVVTANAANSRTITLTGNGVPPPIQAEVRPTSVSFGDVRRDTDSTLAQVSVRSTGSQMLSVRSVRVSPSQFTLASGSEGFQLLPNAARNLDVTCRPSAVGDVAGSLTVISDDPRQSTITVPLTCKGIDSNLDISPSPAVLRTTRVGEPIDATLQLVNSGGAPMRLDSVTITTTGPGAGFSMTTVPPPGTMLAAAGSTQVGIHFDAANRGDVSATLLATYDGGQRRSTQITARALATSMALTPDGDVDFGPVCAGGLKAQQFTLIANEQGSFVVRSVSSPARPFQLSMPTLPIAVAGAGATQAHFQVTASPMMEGDATSPVTLQTDIPNAAERTINLRVRGLPAGVSATPEEIDLGSLPINTTALGQEAHLSNCDSEAITFSNARIEGDDAADFAIVQQPASATIAPAGTVSWLIVLQAHSVGPKLADFVVDHDGGTARIPLQGEGLGDLPEIVRRGSYYACSTGDAAALWPVALGLALVLRRRRRR